VSDLQRVKVGGGDDGKQFEQAAKEAESDVVSTVKVSF
jgi:hypothetical protein